MYKLEPGMYAKNTLWLVTPEELALLPDGFELTSITGDKVIKGKDYIDGDTRGGHTAFGITFPPMEHPEAEVFTKIKLQLAK